MSVVFKCKYRIGDNIPMRELPRIHQGLGNPIVVGVTFEENGDVVYLCIGLHSNRVAVTLGEKHNYGSLEV